MNKILLVAGHGAGDPGAVNGSNNERDAMRALAKAVKALLPNTVDVYDPARNMYYDTVNGGGMHSTKYKEVIELHMDSERTGTVRGGHVIIRTGYKPDALDKRLADAVKHLVGIKGQFLNAQGFSYRTNLLNLNIAARRGISYRLVEFGFISNAQDRKAMITEVANAAKHVASAITGKTVAPQKPAPPKEVDELTQLLPDTQQKDMKALLAKAYQDKVFTKDHSQKVDKMTRGEALDLLISYTARTAK